MSAAGERPVTAPGRRLPSIFDGFPTGVPVTFDALEVAMAADTERRILATLDRAVGYLADRQPAATPGEQLPEASSPRSGGPSPP